MERFRVLFFNGLGSVFSEQDIEAEDERSAVDYAHRVFESGIGLGYEIRDNAKRLIDRRFFT
jgi:hypothetical protein